MTRLLRWAFNVAAAVSAVLFAGACVLWVRSAFASDQVSWHTQRLPDGVWEKSDNRLFQLYLRSTRDGVSGMWGVNWKQGHWANPGVVWELGQEAGDAPGWADYERPTKFPLLGAKVEWEWFGPDSKTRSDSAVRGGAVVPWWMLALLSGAPPALAAYGSRRRRRVRDLALPRRNRCPSCGYDTRATPSRCPECGTASGPGVA